MWQWICARVLKHMENGLVLCCPQRIKKQFFIPKNFAHGFIVLSESAEFAYKCTDFYHPNDEGGLKWDDPEIGVEWPMPEGMTKEELTISDKDQKWGSFAEYKKSIRGK